MMEWKYHYPSGEFQFNTDDTSIADSYQKFADAASAGAISMKDFQNAMHEMTRRLEREMLFGYPVIQPQRLSKSPRDPHPDCMRCRLCGVNYIRRQDNIPAMRNHIYQEHSVGQDIDWIPFVQCLPEVKPEQLRLMSVE